MYSVICLLLSHLASEGGVRMEESSRLALVKQKMKDSLFIPALTCNSDEANSIMFSESE